MTDTVCGPDGAEAGVGAGAGDEAEVSSLDDVGVDWVDCPERGIKQPVRRSAASALVISVRTKVAGPSRTLPHC